MAVAPKPVEGEEPSNEAADNSFSSDIEVTVSQAQELVARLTAVRAALQDHLEDNPIVYTGFAALLDFVDQICGKLKTTVLGAGSGPLQELLVEEVGRRLHEVDIAKHFTPPSFEAKIRQMNGYQSHIVSPESAVTALISDAFSDCAPISQWMVIAVRSFLSEAARNCASDVVERDPDHRQQLADMIVQAMEEVLNEWEKEAEVLAREIMEMEKMIVSSVFFQRLAIKRKQAEQRGGGKEGFGAGVKVAAAKVRSSGAGLLARLRGKGADNESGGRSNNRSTDPDESEAEMSSHAPSFQGGRRAPPRPSSAFQPEPARNLRFAKHLKTFDGVKALRLKDAATESAFDVIRGKCFKRAHATGIRTAVTKSWSSRYFIFDCQKRDLFYWKEQPTAEFLEANGDQEYYKATRLCLSKARIVPPSKDDMKGFNGGPESCGVRIENAFVKNKFDAVILAFATEAEWNSFLRHVTPQLEVAPEPEPEEEPVEEEPEPEEPEAEEFGGYREEEENPPAPPEEEDALDDSLPDSPTATYRKGGLGVGSHFFSMDDIRDRGGDKVLTGEIIVPKRFRSTARSREGSEGDGSGVTQRVEGSEVMLWLTSDMNMYVTIVKDTVAATLPKMAVSVLIERIVGNDMLHLIQKKAVQWQDVVEEQGGNGARTLHSINATTRALADLEDVMNAVRMAQTSATLLALRDKSAPARCKVPVNALALAGHSQLLASAQRPPAATVIEDEYGPLFPFKALESSDAAARRWLAASDFDRTAPVHVEGDPLAPPNGGVTHMPQGEDGKQSGGGFRSSIADVTTSVAEFAGRMRNGMTGRKRATEQDVEEERRNLQADSQPLGRPQRAPSRPVPRSDAPPEPENGVDALSAPAGGDPLGGGGLGPVMGFGADPLSAPRRREPPAATQAEPEEDDKDGAPLAQASTSTGGPPRAPPRSAPTRAAPPRRAPPGPGGVTPRTAPPPPAVGRPAPLRAAPGRPAPVAANRPAPMRPAPKPSNLPL